MSLTIENNIREILNSHKNWLNNKNGKCADLSYLNLMYRDLSNVDLRGAYLKGVNLKGAILYGTNLKDADLSDADLSHSCSIGVDLTNADLTNANLKGANLTDSYLSNTYLTNANLTNTILIRADLTNSNLTNAKGLTKIMGVEVGNIYYKKFDKGLSIQDLQFKIGINKLFGFHNDERKRYGNGHYYFGSKTYCEINNKNYPLLAKIRIPEGAIINEPWATDGEASADMIEILQVWDKQGNDVTDLFK